MSRAAQKAVALAQQEKSTWTRADLIKYLGRVLPRSGLDPSAAAALLEDLADRALRSEFEPVLCLEAPEAVEVPRSLLRADGRSAYAALLEDLADRALRSEFEPVLCLEAPEAVEVPRGLLRADGRSVYQRHGGVRYATRAQLAMEDRMLAQARADGAPRLTRADAARALGADPERLEHALAGFAHDAHDACTETGLRGDQAAAALSALTDGKRVSVINAPAGSGKTRVLFELARAWESAGLGPVIGITPSQSARNTLAAGIPVSYNTAQFLGHLPGQRGARGPVAISPGTLLSVDETSMISGPELADLISLADATGRQGDPGRGHRPAAGGGKRRRHVPARRSARLRPARRAGPVPRRLGAGCQPAAARR